MDSLNEWAEWLAVERLPSLIELPLVQIAEKSGITYFWLPSKTPPTAPEAIQHARLFFETLLDREADRHAAQ